jgi:dTDP-4-dehydrorhamnose reductase
MIKNTNKNQEKIKILVLGASGMLGSAVMLSFIDDEHALVKGTVRSQSSLSALPKKIRPHVHTDINVEDFDSLIELFNQERPDIVINCVGIIKQLTSSYNPLTTIPVNSIFPHRLAKLCLLVGARLVHMSTDCVFSGTRGGYLEGDQPDANDLYGRSKYLGEVDYPGCVTLRTSIIGHELNSSNSLIDWFLSQEGSVKGYKNAIFSGLPTNEMARVIRDYVFPNPDLRGLYHVSVDPISKYDLLHLVADIYGKNIQIVPDDSVKIDRSLNSQKFCEATGFEFKSWPQLINEMFNFRQTNKG